MKSLEKLSIIGGKKFLVLVLLALLTVVAVIFIFDREEVVRSAAKDREVIVLRGDGFDPMDVTILKGGTVTFKTERGKPFWPASSLHPIHSIYSEFDPLRPIEPDNTWSFTFDRVGTWRFHDHLAPRLRGTITVIEGGNEAAAVRSLTTECPDLEGEIEKRQCWENAIETAFKEGTFSNAFLLYEELYRTEPLFAQNCHGFTHIIGEEAYDRFSKSEDFEITDQVSYCSYGFFHGFMEPLVKETGSYEGSREFCDYIDEQLRGQTWSLGACLHGIGHGVTDASDPRTWGDVHAVIDPGLALCEEIGKTEFEVKLCATGVYNSLSELYFDPTYKLSYDPNDPFAICREQENTNLRHACYDDLKTLILGITDGDFRAAARYIEETAEEGYAEDAMDNLATYYVYWLLDGEEKYTDAIRDCQSFKESLQVSCVRGLGAGFMTAGTPGLEYVQALEVCASSLLTEPQRAGCYDRVLGSTYNRYSREKHESICATVPVQYRGQFCRNVPG